MAARFDGEDSTWRIIVPPRSASANREADGDQSDPGQPDQDLHAQRVETALAQGDSRRRQISPPEAEPEIRRGVTRGVLHLNNASSKISRLVRRVRALAPSDAAQPSAV